MEVQVEKNKKKGIMQAINFFNLCVYDNGKFAKRAFYCFSSIASTLAICMNIKMNVMIIYSSKYGCTADCAKYVKSGLSGLVTITDIDKTNYKSIELGNYDTVIFGSSIYIGAISKKMQIFCKENIDLLNTKRVGIFICCTFPEQLNEYLSKNFPPTLLENAVVVKGFGGEARIDKLKMIDKMIMKAAAKGNYENLKISHENIESFIKEMNMQYIKSKGNKM